VKYLSSKEGRPWYNVGGFPVSEDPTHHGANPSLALPDTTLKRVAGESPNAFAALREGGIVTDEALEIIFGGAIKERDEAVASTAARATKIHVTEHCIKALMENLGWSASQAMDVLKVPEEEREHYASIA